jgi:hypothetical protein
MPSNYIAGVEVCMQRLRARACAFTSRYAVVCSRLNVDDGSASFPFPFIRFFVTNDVPTLENNKPTTHTQPYRLVAEDMDSVQNASLPN